MGVDMEAKRNIVRCQCLGIDQAAGYRHHGIFRGMPNKCRGCFLRHQQVAGVFVDKFLPEGVGLTGQIPEAAHMDTQRLRGDHRVAQDAALDRLALRECFTNFGAIVGIGLVCCQMTTGREAHDGDLLRIDAPGFCVGMDLLHGCCYLTQLRREADGLHGIVQHKHIAAHGQ